MCYNTVTVKRAQSLPAVGLKSRKNYTKIEVLGIGRKKSKSIIQNSFDFIYRFKSIIVNVKKL